MFNNIIGNEENKQVLKELIDKNKFSASFMFIGKQGVGKKIFAREFAYYIIKRNFDKDLISNDDMANLQDYIEIAKERKFCKNRSN